MIRLEKTEVVGWDHAIRGMRNPLNSWDKSDSIINDHVYGLGHAYRDLNISNDIKTNRITIGENDLDLMRRLRNAGTDHRKFMRMIMVYVDIIAPLYWWKEFDTYKVGTVANSCSTMHKITDKEFTPDDFSCEHIKDYMSLSNATSSALVFDHVIQCLNFNREMYLKTKDKMYWWQLIQLLPSSYNQKRTVMINYEVLANIYKSRKNHKLDEWIHFCDWIGLLPHSELITGLQE